MKKLIEDFEIPCLTSRGLNPLYPLEKQLLDSQSLIEAWLRDQWHKTPPPFYSSVDLRNAGFKLAPVDTNLFPAGFNNLKEEFIALAVQAAQETLDRLAPCCRRILVVPESHTRNQFYFENLAALQDILRKAGFEVRIGSLSEDIPQKREISLASGRTLVLEKIKRNNDQLMVQNFLPCIILLNNDLASGIPDIFKDITQLILPSVQLGWFRRLKSEHFKEYNQVCEELTQLLAIDPWLICALFTRCEPVDFSTREGEHCLMEQSHYLLTKIQKKYDEYGIEERPYLIIKADAGTYGMGVLSIFDPSEIQHLNRKKRGHMKMSKGNRPIRQVIIQEGIYTFETWNKAVAEPVVSMLGQYVIGGFYRVHTGRGVSDNLNSPGMQFKPLPFIKPCNIPDMTTSTQDKCANRFYVYGVIARLALLAAAREEAHIKK